MSNIKLTKTEQSILSEIQSGILVGHYNYHWRSGDRIKHGDELTQRQVKAVESLIAKGLVVMQNGICTTPTISDGVIAQQVGGEQLEVTADYAPVYTHTITAPDGRVIRVNDITPAAPDGEEREDEAYMQGDAAATNADRLLTELHQTLGRIGRAVMQNPLGVSGHEFWHGEARGVIWTGIQAIYLAAWADRHEFFLGSNWQAVKPRVGMMRIDTIGFVILNVSAVMIGKWGWQIGSDSITHLPTGKVAQHLPTNRENEAMRGEMAIIAMLMLERVIGKTDIDNDNDWFERGRKLCANTLDHWYQTGNLPRATYPSREVGALKAKITRQAKAPKN